MITPNELKLICSDLPNDQKLIGDRLKEVFGACGIPPCGGCETRRIWINNVELYLRSKLRCLKLE